MSHATTRPVPPRQSQSSAGLDELYNDLDSFITELQHGLPPPPATPPHTQQYTPSSGPNFSQTYGEQAPVGAPMQTTYYQPQPQTGGYVYPNANMPTQDQGHHYSHPYPHHMPVPYPMAPSSAPPYPLHPSADVQPGMYMPTPNGQTYQPTINDSNIYPPPDYERTSASSRSPPRSPPGSPHHNSNLLNSNSANSPFLYPREEQGSGNTYSMQSQDATWYNSADRGQPPVSLSLDISKSHKAPLVPVSPPDSPDSEVGMGMPSSTLALDIEPALISELSREFKREIRKIFNLRELFFSAEYPESFTGHEAVSTLRKLLPPDVDEKMPLKIARALMHTTPQLFYPIPYSEQSIKKNTVIDSPDEAYTFDEDATESDIPQGVLTVLTKCYVRDCLPSEGGCYAPRCPNKVLAEEEVGASLERQHSITSVTSSVETASTARAWSANVSKEILESVSKDEIRRQEAIYELIYTEEDYVRDLDLLDELFAKSLRTANCIEAHRREAFCSEVFYNYLEIREVNSGMMKELRDRQYEKVFVERVGDILLKHVKNFDKPYIKYGPHFVISEYNVKSEDAKNPDFSRFIKDREKQPETRRLPLRHFLIFPITRLQRYSLLIDAVLKKTPESHPDFEALTEAIKHIRGIASQVDELTEGNKQKVRLWQIAEKISFKPGDTDNLRLYDEQRVLIYDSELKRRNDTGLEWMDLRVFLFDNYLVMTKPRKEKNVDVQYVVSKRPIPLDMLRVVSDDSGGRAGTQPPRNSTTASTFTPAAAPIIAGAGTLVPLAVSYLGRRGGTWILFATSANERKIWKDKIQEAKARLDSQRQDVFQVRTLSDSTFPGSGAPGTVTVNCTVPFVRADYKRMVAVGTESGVWVGVEGDTTSFTNQFPLLHVTQIAVLEEQHIFVVLADKTLFAYALDAAFPPAGSRPPDRTPQKLAQHVSYFNVGVCNNRTLVVSMRKRNTESHFKAMEPVCGDLRNPKNKFTTSRGMFGGRTPEWFKTYKEFYVGAESTLIHFLKTKIAVVSLKGFEIIDLEHLNMNRGLPDIKEPQFAFLARRSEDLKPLAMYRVMDRFLLCYQEFAFFIDNHGSLAKNHKLIEWDATPDYVALYYPYILAFEPHFVEVRNVESGALVQVIAGDNMRCIHYAGDTNRPVIHGCMAHGFTDYQLVFQLIANDIRRNNVSAPQTTR